MVNWNCTYVGLICPLFEMSCRIEKQEERRTQRARLRERRDEGGKWREKGSALYAGTVQYRYSTNIFTYTLRLSVQSMDVQYSVLSTG